MIDVGVCGAAGHIGQLLIQSILDSDDLRLVAAFDTQSVGVDAAKVARREDCGVPITQLADTAVSACDVVVDFSLPKGTSALVQLALDTPLVIGTTGLGAQTQESLEVTSRTRAVVQAANFSTGVNILLELVATASRMAPHAHPEIVEMHHARKRDSPSGTAIALADVIVAARGGKQVHGRSGECGPRGSDEIGIHALRGGDVVGEHRVVLALNGERLELGHVASSRRAFAEGALAAARWVAGRPPGLYSMRDVLGF
jgi:4-hydroxy-tetrahydrodipicolinate reductase